MTSSAIVTDAPGRPAQLRFEPAQPPADGQRDRPLPHTISAPSAAAAVGIGTLLIAIGYAGGRSGAGWAQIPFWAGEVLSFGAIAAAVASRTLSDRARLAVVLMEAAQQCLVRWMYTPLFFSFPDELQHWRTAQDILATHHLFASNPTLPISPLFPGLEELATALSSLTQVNLHVAGLIVTTTAQVALAAAIFELARRVCRDSRPAGVAAVLFAITPQHAGFDTQFIYLGPALLFSIVGLNVVLGRERRSPTDAAAAVACMAAVVVTHHLTAIFTVAALGAIGLIVAVQTRLEPRTSVTRSWALSRRLLLMATTGAVLMAGWVVGVAPRTFSYLLGPIRNAFGGSGGQGGGHAANAAAASTGGPLGTGLEIAGVFTTAILVLAGLALVWRGAGAPNRGRSGVLMRAFSLLAMSYFGVLLAHQVLADGAEISTRLWTYAAVFTSVTVAVALAGDNAIGARLARWRRPAALVAMLLIFLGGITSGWPPQWELLPGRFRIAGFEGGIDRQNTAAVQWFAKHVGRGRHVACDFSSCSLLGAYADAYPVGDASSIYYAARVTPGVIRTIRDKQIQYVLVDRRMSSQTPVTGAYFSRDTEAGDHTRPVPLRELVKFGTTPRVHEIYDNGTVVIYDVRGLLHG